MPVKIDPESFVSRNDLRFDFGLTDFVIDEAIRSGQLSPVQGASSRFLGDEVIRFLTSSRSNGVSGQSRGLAAAESANPVPQRQGALRATSATGMTPRTKTMTTDEAKGVVRLFNEEVAATMAHGCDRGRAIEVVSGRNPRLHKLYLIATNLNRPAARRQIMEAY